MKIDINNVLSYNPESVVFALGMEFFGWGGPSGGSVPCVFGSAGCCAPLISGGKVGLSVDQGFVLTAQSSPCFTSGIAPIWLPQMQPVQGHCFDPTLSALGVLNALKKFCAASCIPR